MAQVRLGENETSITATGVQALFDHNGSRREVRHHEPKLLPWRCNLIGLSQQQNLFFVAHNAHIHVHVPQYPTQALRQLPSLVFASQPSEPNLKGYLDAARPHAINYLLVQFLGNDEVVATVRDDGDVDVFLVRHITQAMQRRAEPGSSIGVFADEVRPIFQANVGASAWGLAIHTQTRVLATSSNAHEIRIFKFGLHQMEGEPSRHNPTLGDDQRATDVTHRIWNGAANIPHIAFCNTGDDPEGRWLLTTDIDGNCQIMDVHAVSAVQRFRFGHGLLEPSCSGISQRSAGWIISFLDRRSFYEESSVHGATGLRPGDRLSRLGGIQRGWDIGERAKHIHGHNEPFIFRIPNGQGSTPHQAPDQLEMVPPSGHTTPPEWQQYPESDSAEDGVYNSDAADEEMEDEDGGVSLGQSLDDVIETDVVHDADMHESLGVSPDDDFDHLANSALTAMSNNFSFLIDPDDQSMPVDDERRFISSVYGTLRGNRPVFMSPETPLCDDLPCPIFHSSVTHAFLMQPSDQRKLTGPNRPPVVGLEDALRQQLQIDFDYLHHFERLNMFAYIPPLGIIVLASQKGRALVLALTKVAHPVRYARGPPVTETIYAMRIECILPFVEQEEKNQRPVRPLYGIAVSPIQGGKSDRWRLIMMYQDHTILSYEISRGKAARNSAVAVENLII